MTENKYDLLDVAGGAPVKAWTRGVAFEDEARRQLENTARLPFIYKWVAAMPDVHWGMGATIGSVVATTKAIVPAAVGVDIGCGMCALRTELTARDLPDDLERVRSAIETAVPHGRTPRGRDKGSWGTPPKAVETAWSELEPVFKSIIAKHPRIKNSNHRVHLGTLGTGNHFIEVCLDEADRVWLMLHSGSRGVGNKIGRTFIDLAKKEMDRLSIELEDKNLAHLTEGTDLFDDYIEALNWAQRFAKVNRALMLDAVVRAVSGVDGITGVGETDEFVDCHHNYMASETHYGQEVFVTRKGAVRARIGDRGIIPGSMGARSFIVRGKGHPESFTSCSHGAGRTMSRREALRRFSVDDHIRATKGVACRKDKKVLDETPQAYKPIDVVMAAQEDLVEVLHTLRQVVCVKG
jgi:tRNA-splicing ligase RtcB (3'-phosphate/5'-hydroxy nucleic acid ligase)